MKSTYDPKILDKERPVLQIMLGRNYTHDTSPAQKLQNIWVPSDNPQYIKPAADLEYLMTDEGDLLQWTPDLASFSAMIKPFRGDPNDLRIDITPRTLQIEQALRKSQINRVAEFQKSIIRSALQTGIMSENEFNMILQADINTVGGTQIEANPLLQVMEERFTKKMEERLKSLGASEQVIENTVDALKAPPPPPPPPNNQNVFQRPKK